MMDLASAFAAIDAAFDSPRPKKFTDHPYCEECAEAHEYFRDFTPLTITESHRSAGDTAPLIPH